MVLSIISLVFAVVALAVNVSALARRPRIVATWGPVQDVPAPREGLSIIVTARRRSIEVDEIGIALLDRAPRFRQCPEWLHEDTPPRMSIPIDRRAGDLPRRLEDGQSLRAYIELDDAIDDKPWPSGSGHSYPYVKASGTVYLGREKSKLREWWQRQQSPSRS